ncbi:acidic mammalian chitinase [Lichtheimia corymbifera JMRC:FSU:9682]|uniref:Acidic mammalian chitinase n=1 Tax=Lichtheimia corymbifera JMRC:FSU:9682 TaxID=1263082 RepID=A0A068RHW5_9FUNG|nr:acidic mammalian chitinase [Lichtheimia corymbifera JMRC:FSU:9682]
MITLPGRLFLLFQALVLVLAATTCNAAKHKDGGVIAYVVDWDLPSKIAWNKLDQVIYSFAEPEKNGKLSGFDESQLKSVVKEGHKHDTLVSLAVGGWTGSLYFSDLAKTEKSRQKFAKNIAKLVKKYDLDGVNLDWEYPNSPNGVACNANDPHDTANYLKLIQTLREVLPKHTLITAAVGTTPFNDENQQPSTHLDKNWAKAIDGIYIMGYDINGIWNTQAGANAPLRANAKAAGIDTASVDSAVKAWTAAGIPSEKLVLGVPFYGRIGQTTGKAHGLYGKLDTSEGQIRGDQYDSKEKDPCPNAKASYSGQYEWRSIAKEGIARNESGWNTVWDSISQTPVAVKGSKFITFDDAHSLHAKAQYAKKQKLSGVMLWSLEMDDAHNTLLNALQGVRSKH